MTCSCAPGSIAIRSRAASGSPGRAGSVVRVTSTSARWNPWRRKRSVTRSWLDVVALERRLPDHLDAVVPPDAQRQHEHRAALRGLEGRRAEVRLEPPVLAEPRLHRADALLEAALVEHVAGADPERGDGVVVRG